MKAMRIGLFLVVALVSVVAGAFWWLTEAEEAVPRTTIPFSDLNKYRQWLDDYHPARLRSGETYRLTLAADDIQKLAILLAATQPALANTQFQAAVTPSLVVLELWWPTGLAERFLPLRLVWRPETPFHLRRIAVAGVPLPSYLVEGVNQRLAALSAVDDAERLWRQLDPRITLAEGAVTVAVDWRDPELVGWIADFAPFWSGGGQQRRLRQEVRWLADWMARQEDFRIPLTAALEAMLSRPDLDWQEDAAAVLGALSYATLGSTFGLDGESLPELPFKRFTLRERYDLARHFVLAMWLGTQMDPQSVLELAVYKEWSDAMTRPTGFSAEDMMANVAGLRFLAWLDNQSPAGRKEIGPLTDDILMPPEAFWQPWLRQGETLTQAQLRELVADTRAWLDDSPLYRP